MCQFKPEIPVNTPILANVAQESHAINRHYRKSRDTFCEFNRFVENCSVHHNIWPIFRILDRVSYKRLSSNPNRHSHLRVHTAVRYLPVQSQVHRTLPDIPRRVGRLPAHGCHWSLLRDCVSDCQGQRVAWSQGTASLGSEDHADGCAVAEAYGTGANALCQFLVERIDLPAAADVVGLHARCVQSSTDLLFLRPLDSAARCRRKYSLYFIFLILTFDYMHHCELCFIGPVCQADPKRLFL